MSEYFRVTPSNSNSTGTYQFSNGQNLLNFILAPGDHYLQGNSLKLCGKFTATTSTGATASLNPRVSIMSIVEQLSISSRLTGQSIETIKFYPRFLSSYYSTLSSDNQLLGSMAVSRGSSNSTGTSKELVDQGNGTDFSIDLVSGLFSSGLIPMMNDGTGTSGLFISCQLNSDAAVFNCDTGETATYALTDVYLSGVIAPSDPSIERPSQMMYNSVNSYFGIIESGFATLSYNLGLSKVLGAWVNLVPSSDVQNIEADSQRTTPIMSSATAQARPSEVTFLRSGIKFPLEYSIRDEYPDNQMLFNSQIMRNYISAIRKFSNLGHNDVSPLNSNNVQSLSSGADKIVGDQVFGFGVSLDSVSNSGVDYTNETFGINVVSDLKTGFNNSAYLFVHAKQSLVFSKDGLQILN